MDIEREAMIINNLFYSSIIGFCEEEKTELEKIFKASDPIDFILNCYLKSTYHPAAEIYKGRKKTILKIFSKMFGIEDLNEGGESFLINLKFNSIMLNVKTKTFIVYPSKYLELKQLKKNLASSKQRFIEAKAMSYLYIRAKKERKLKFILMLARYSSSYRKYKISIIINTFKRINKKEDLTKTMFENQKRIYHWYLDEQKNLLENEPQTIEEAANSEVIKKLKMFFKEVNNGRN